MSVGRPFRQAVAQVKPGSSVLLPSACATSTGVNDELARQSHRLSGSRLWSGLLLGHVPFTEAPHRQRLRYGTWHLARSMSDLAASGDVDFYPLRASHVVDFLLRKGLNDVVVAQVAPPDPEGYCSLGVSGSYVEAAVAAARKLVLHINPLMPRTRGCRVRLSDAATVVTTEEPLLEHVPASTDEVSRRIAHWIEPLIPDGATLQVGYGSVPEALLESLLETDRGSLAVWGMATDGVVALDEADKLRKGPATAVHAHDVLGTRRILDWIDDNERFRLVGYDIGTSQEVMGRTEGFVSVNSAVEVDLFGNANAEVVGGRQISGVGASLDFASGARRSRGGVSLLALPATARKGAVSRIVPSLGEVPHSISRTTVQYVVTEHGAVDLSLLSLNARADAMIGLAAPEFRDELWEQFDKRMSLSR